MRPAVAALFIALAMALAAGVSGPAPWSATTPAAASQPAAGAAIDPFTIDVPDDVLADLKERLARARMPDEPEGVGWQLGMNRAYLRQLVDYWRDEFDWRAQERRLNRLEQFKTTIDGLDIHFVHRRSAEPDAFPLILTHGWPGTFAEFDKVIEPLTDPVAHGGRAEDAFHVVAPSIPGYGFSDRPTRLGYGRDRTGAIFAELMARLGYERYGTQGGDLGAGISRWLAANDAEHVAGLHLNLCTAGPPDPENPTAGVPPEEIALMEERAAFWTDEERGYSHMHGTKPQTLGYSLNDSPVGLARVDRREVPELVRLRRQPRDAVQQGRAADDPHHLLGHGDRDLRRPLLLRGPARRQRAGPGPDRGADRLRGVPRRVPVHAAAVARGALQPRPLHDDAERRPLRGERGAGAVGRRPARVLPGPAVGVCAVDGPVFGRRHRLRPPLRQQAPTRRGLVAAVAPRNAGCAARNAGCAARNARLGLRLGQ